ncbi:hypothetical protein [Pseudonocardia spinosispora]|uniref:hypothetical protein n=1 Tax=Pseudonocardia spinosispora TaxID=103441 RepID=UPI00040A48C7|nr:hypothetical protein [Pseudonocardia spinosispora]
MVERAIGRYVAMMALSGMGQPRSYYAGGGSIDVTIKNVPEGWGWTWVEDQSYRDGRVQEATPAMRALRQEVERIHSAYNYDNSDSQTDYFERRYYGSVGNDPWLRFPRY